jgi:microcin C transport system substrate-binding protein
MKKLLLLCALALSFSLSAGAQEPALDSENNTPKVIGPVEGMAMHGEIKYSSGFKHLEYVNPNAPKGGKLRQHVYGSFDSLNPFIVKGSPAAGMSFLGTGLLYESLMTQTNDEPFSMYGIIARTIEMPEDRSWVAFNLREEARWHDGTPITSEDVIWTFNTMMEKGTPFFKAYYGDVKEAIAEGPNRVKFIFNVAGNMELPLIMSQISILPKHYWEKEENDFTETTLVPPLGSGPYKIKEVKAGQKITYERTDDWWAKDLPINVGRYNFDLLEYEYYLDHNVALEAFFAGEYDVREENTAKLWATAYDAPPVLDGRIIKKKIENERPQGMQGFIYNTRKPVFSDVIVREALAYAFDFEWSNKQFAFGSYKRSQSFYSNSDLASSGLPIGRELEILEKYKDTLPERVFTEEYIAPATDGSGNNRKNLRQAIKLLEEAGYVLGEDAVRVHKETGVKLKFEIIDSNPAFERWILPFIQNLEKIGVSANFRVVDSAQYQNLMNEFNFDMTVMSFGQSSSPGNEQRDFWGSAKADISGSRNYMGIQNPAIDSLIEELINAKDREELVHYTRALDRALLWNFYLIPQWHLNAWRLAWWNKFDHPEVFSKYTPGITTTWWAK